MTLFPNLDIFLQLRKLWGQVWIRLVC